MIQRCKWKPLIVKSTEEWLTDDDMHKKALSLSLYVCVCLYSCVCGSVAYC